MKSTTMASITHIDQTPKTMSFADGRAIELAAAHSRREPPRTTSSHWLPPLTFTLLRPDERGRTSAITTPSSPATPPDPIAPSPLLPPRRRVGVPRGEPLRDSRVLNAPPAPVIVLLCDKARANAQSGVVTETPCDSLRACALQAK